MQLSKKSDAMHLFQLMCPEPIRDETMYWLTPMDIVNFIIGTGIRFSEEDEAKYTCIYKHIIPDRRWLMKKRTEGYKFTLMVRNLARFTSVFSPKVVTKDVSESSIDNTGCIRSLDVILFITKKENLIACTEEFASTEKFMHGSQNALHVSDIVSRSYEHYMRAIYKSMGDYRIVIRCPLSSHSTNKPLFLSSNAYGHDLKEKGHLYWTAYLDMERNNSKPVGPILSDRDNKYRTENADVRFFSIWNLGI